MRFLVTILFLLLSISYSNFCFANRLLRKLATEEQVIGAHGAQNRSVHKVREDLSTGATTQLPSVVEFPKKSNEANEWKLDDEPGELKFLKGVSKYQIVNYRWEKFKALRELKEFKVGKKYCLWGTDKWDDGCQDAAMKYAYGADWRAIKRLLVEFLDVHKRNDPVAFGELFSYPLYVNRSNGFGRYAPYYIDDPEDGNNYFLETKELLDTDPLDKIPYDERPKELMLRDSLVNTTYKDALILDFWRDNRYVVRFNKIGKIVLSFGDGCSASESNCKYDKLITRILY